MYVTYSLLSSRTVFVDINCGQQLQCPRYCKDEYYKKMYCTPICRTELTEAICNQGLKPIPLPLFSGYHFWPQNSSTFQLMNKNDWYSNSNDFGKQSGKHFTDTLTFISDEDDTSNLTIQNAEMVDGMLLNVVFFFWSGGVVGLAPGDGNIVSQLYAQKLISFPTALLIVRNDKWDGVLGFGIDLQKNEDCEQNWSQHLTKDPNYWVLELEVFEMNGLSYGKKTKALFSNSVGWVYLPNEFLIQLVHADIIDIYNDFQLQEFAFTIPCDQPLELNFTIDGRNLTMSKQALTYKQIDNNTCALNLMPYNYPPYLNDVNMQIGRSFLLDFCVGFDYEKTEISFTKRVKDD
ncbi:hypothetical protein M3Y95_01024500 [Aphelenchoides besseyi]|nr:hypothetical protein M3Y95_01024500 [Aphelenchoides besseyi]